MVKCREGDLPKLTAGDRVAVVSPSFAAPALFPAVRELAMRRLRAVAAYNPEAMVVFDLDFGHTDPQWVLPYGGRITVDARTGGSPLITDPPVTTAASVRPGTGHRVVPQAGPVTSTASGASPRRVRCDRRPGRTAK